MPRYTREVGLKFNEDGSARDFPGNTVLCHVPRPSQQFNFLVKMRDKTAAQPWEKKFHFLPPASYHMTLFDCVCDQERRMADWSSKLPLDAPLGTVDAFLRENFPKVQPPAKLEVEYRFFYTARGYVGMYVQTTSPEIENAIRAYRNEISATFGIRHANHQNYGFHITLAYQIEYFTPLERLQALVFNWRAHRLAQREFGTLELNPPELCFFADMTHFGSTR
jgi:hypothetical protein